MSKQNVDNALSTSARILLAFLFVFAQTAWAGQTQNAKDKPDAGGKAKVQQLQDKPSPVPAAKARATEEEDPEAQNQVPEDAAPRGGPHEGIKVHGHWTIEVRNPDGGLASHQEFENSLNQARGATFLAAVLGRTQSIGFWAVQLFGASGGPCVQSATNGGTPSSCVIYENGYTAFPTDPSIFRNLTIAASSGQFILSGTATAEQNDSINAVATAVYSCGLGIAPANCNAFTALFTSANPPAVNVSTGQTIAVTVVISFS